MNLIQDAVQALEVGKGQILVRIVPLLTALLVVTFLFDATLYRGLNDAQSMDNAQLARRIVRGQGFTTEFLRPFAVMQLHDYNLSQSLKSGTSSELFPSDRFPSGTPRVLPDTYNAPGYPYLLAGFFRLTHPEFAQSPQDMATNRIYSAGERWIPLLNQAFMFLTAILVFILGYRLFDDRVAWMSAIAFLATDLIWRYTLTALSTSVLMFLVTAVLACAVEIYCIGEACFESKEHRFWPAWIWAFVMGLLLAAACLTQLTLLVLLIPLLFLLIIMPRANWFLTALVVLIVLGAVTPWFLHLRKVSGNFLGSNTTVLLLGQGDFQGNQIYRTTALPAHERLYRNTSDKEYAGFLWHFEHAWNLLGTSPLILMFGASILHKFKRPRTRLFHWFLFGAAIVLIAMTSLGSTSPEAFGPWNTLILLFPCMLVIGSAFYFILLDRMSLHLRLLRNLIITVTLVLSAMPLVLTLSGKDSATTFNPYVPFIIKNIGQFSGPDEWVTSDMPWATAWYADRPSLWLPDSISDFENLHDNICPTGVLLLTPVTWSQPLSNVTTGEDKDWFSLAIGLTLPANFPLQAHVTTGAKGPQYSIWSDHVRW